MAHPFCCLAVLALAGVVSGAYNCPSGWKGQSGTPQCAGAVASTCSKTTCCEAVPTCTTFAVAWALTQLVGAGCAADTKFFDMHKATNEVADPAGDAQVKAACCTPFAQAKCSDWSVVLGSCPSGHAFVGTNSAPPDNGDGKTLSKAKYQTMCCVKQLKKCSSFTVAWVISQGLGAGCAADTKFFDMKKATTEVADPAGTAQVKAACCTPFAQAKCSDWSAVWGVCPSGHSFVGTNSAPPDNGDGKTLSKVKYQQMCCIKQLKKCSSFAVAWVISQGLGAGCAADTKFFDMKKATTEVADPAGTTEVKAACCTPFAQAQCSDWAAVLGACPSGKFFSGTNSAPPDNSDGKTLSKAKYQQMCCVNPMKCADYTMTQTSSVSQATASMVTSVLAITAVMVA